MRFRFFIPSMEAIILLQFMAAYIPTGVEIS